MTRLFGLSGPDHCQSTSARISSAILLNVVSYKIFSGNMQLTHNLGGRSCRSILVVDFDI